MEPLAPKIISPKSPNPIPVKLYPHRFWCSNRCKSKKWSMPMHSCASDNVKLAESSKLQLNNRKDFIESIAKGFVGFAAAATALASICFDSPAFAESLTVAFPASRAPEEYQSFRIGSDGNLQGVGLFISVEPRTGHLVVLSCVEDSPAARAGIHEGDELIEINGERLDGIDSEAAALKLRGRAGTPVTVKVHSGKDVGRESGTREVNIPRGYIKLSPISRTIIPHRTPDGHLTKTGYVKLSAFSQTAAADMANTIHELESEGAHSYILDLRNNPGGLVKAGLDVAQIWLDGDETLVNAVDREGHTLPINMVDGHAITHDPLVVLVNEGSASASEILAGALHDNGRAILVGHKTFGKGKIQSVTELHDGSALFVTVAKYLSPALHDIDQVGITPDVQCTTDMLSSPKESLLKNKSSVSSLEADSCIMVAEHELDVQESKGTAS
ncbi:carboxyl-terminal-processing peptidase 3, chloroplastic isoform X2 [Citrus sinensis]|uniref:carboxyl-terminal-processing peptidase 3, chloroplastic isoform X2 n=1 Tax=Citrus sinensis TaxID=2711 RepID=UPI002279D154|nr:carboxyl-terminal-processing peptidase 3, chloroplastic isoform X2 [Citrus sinensis]